MPAIYLKNALLYLQSVINQRFTHATQTGFSAFAFETKPGEASSALEQFAQHHKLSTDELIVLLIALAPHLQPDFYNALIAEHLPEGGDFPAFGGVRGNTHRGILPTGETVQFILAGNNLSKRLEVQQMLGSEHLFAKKHILWLEQVKQGEPVMSGKLVLEPETAELLTTGGISKPRFSIDFPAESIETEMDWDDLVLHADTMQQIMEMQQWIEHSHEIMNTWGLKKRIKPGYRALFYGPPGTGKTLTASLLGKHTGKDVYRIDLSRVVSKYIGETEKNLSQLFDKAENKNWILFFDEADALFGKRTDIRDAHDKYANQEVAYLLQRIENYNGVVILATNQRGNIDDAFARRFQAIIHFPMPGAAEREWLWQKTFPRQIETEKDINWRQVAEQFELSGAGIINVTQYCAVQALAQKKQSIGLKELLTAIKREFIKEGRVV